MSVPSHSCDIFFSLHRLRTSTEADKFLSQGWGHVQIRRFLFRCQWPSYGDAASVTNDAFEMFISFNVSFLSLSVDRSCPKINHVIWLNYLIVSTWIRLCCIKFYPPDQALHSIPIGQFAWQNCNIFNVIVLL